MRWRETRNEKWFFCLGISLCLLVLAAWPTALIDFRYERAALASGQWWRVVTGHMVHLNTVHLLFNLAALVLICELLWGDLSRIQAGALLFFPSLGISGMLWLFHPDVAWYAGLSGILHGLWAGSALVGWLSLQARTDGGTGGFGAIRMRQAPFRYIYPGALILLALKLGWETIYGPSFHTERVIGAPVISIAHLYGALAGIAYVCLWRGIAGLRLQK